MKRLRPEVRRPVKKRARFLVSLGTSSIALLGVLAMGAAPAPQAIQIGYLNRTWTNLEGEVSPVEQGLLSVRLRSPEHRVTVHRNRLALAQRDFGDPDAQIDVDFEGEGRLIADVGSGAAATSFTDDVVAPRQSVRVRGRARVARDAEAYHLTLVDGPPSAPVKIRSRVIDDVVLLCEDLGWLAAVDCDALRASLSTVQIPLAGHDRSVRLPRAQLTPEERAYLDRFVAGAE
jgi:hypothetical protein